MYLFFDICALVESPFHITCIFRLCHASEVTYIFLSVFNVTVCCIFNECKSYRLEFPQPRIVHIVNIKEVLSDRLDFLSAY